MAIKINSDHPTMLLKTKVNEVCNHFLSGFGFSYFQYLRCYANGSVGLLTNDTRLFEYFQCVDNSPVIFSSFDNKYKNSHSYWFLWDEELPALPVQIARENLNIRNGVTLVRRFKQYYDMIAVALPKEQENPGSFYLNKFKAIEHFVMEFDKSNKDLIKIMDSNPISLPEPYRDVNYKNLCLSKGKIIVLGKYGKTYITAQEASCLRLLVLGASYKEIAQIIEVSPRTVETYVSRMKQRTGYLSRFEIERLMSHS